MIHPTPQFVHIARGIGELWPDLSEDDARNLAELLFDFADDCREERRRHAPNYWLADPDDAPEPPADQGDVG